MHYLVSFIDYDFSSKIISYNNSTKKLLSGQIEITKLNPLILLTTIYILM